MVGCVSGCVGTAGCHTLLHLCKSVLSVGDPSLQEGSVQICEICGRKSQQEGSVQICEICGRKSQQEGSVNSVKSVGGNRSKKVRVKSVGELFWLRGVYPPTEQTGRGCSPTDFTDSHRWCVFGVNSAFCGNTVLPRIALINTDGWLR